MGARSAQKIIFFYCHKCKQYEPKTSAHFRNQRRRFARRRKAEREETTANGSSN